MRNKTLHRRLIALEVELDRAAKSIERERASMAERKLTPEQAERTYRQLIERVAKQPLNKELEKLDVHQLCALYLRKVREPAPPAARYFRTPPDGR